MDRKSKQEYRDLLELSTIGIMFPVAIALGYGWGWLLDRWFGTYPILTSVFALFGVVAAFVNLFRMSAKASEGSDGTERPPDELE